jgi:hypothetical protein
MGFSLVVSKLNSVRSYNLKCIYYETGKACLEKWEMIPDDTEILVTHTPPVGFGDLCCSGVRAGLIKINS